MSFRKPCYMPFRKHMLPFTLTGFSKWCENEIQSSNPFFKVRRKRKTKSKFKSVFQCHAETKNGSGTSIPFSHGIEKRLALRYTHSISSWKKRAFFKALVTKRNRSHSLHVKVLDFAPFRGSCVRGFELSHRNQVNSITKITHTHNLHVKVLDVARFKICTWKNAYCLRDYFPQRMF